MNKKIIKKSIKILVAVVIFMAIFAVYQWVIRYGTFERIKNMEIPRRGHTATLLKDGRVLIIGGERDKRKAEIYDPRINKFSLIDNPNLPHYDNHKAILLPNEKVLILDSSGIEIYDPLTNKFSLAGKMLIPRIFFTANLLPTGKILIAGGMSEETGYKETVKAELYDPSTGKSSFTSSMVIPRVGHQAVLSNGKVIIFGGSSKETGSKETGYKETGKVEIYDPKTDQFSLVGDIKIPREYAVATTLKNGKVLIAGGYNDAREPILKAELFDTVTKKSAFAGNIVGPLSSRIPGMSCNVLTRTSKVPLLPNGMVYIGQNSGIQLYNPESGRFVAIKGLGHNCSYQELTLLKNGNILITGGIQNIKNHILRDLVSCPPSCSESHLFIPKQ